MRKLTILFTLVLFAIYSCGPSVEGESKSWKNNIKKLDKLKTDYPAYADMITKKIEEAEAVFKAAESISEEDAKADKMREANNILNEGCVGNLKNMTSKIDDVKNKNRELKKLLEGKSTSDITYAEVVINDGKDAVKTAEKVLNKKSEKLDANPCIKIENAYKELSNTYTDLEEAISNFKEKEQTVNENNETDKETTDNKEEKPKTVKCEYCGKMTAVDKSECKHCAGPVKK